MTRTMHSRADTQKIISALEKACAIQPAEVKELAARYGEPVYRVCELETDEYLRARRWRQVPDRRGEVIFAIREPGGNILVHTKHRYERPIYRLPTGGIHLAESVEHALFREVAEETGLPVRVRRFVGVLDCRFRMNGVSLSFPSYLFFLESRCHQVQSIDDDEAASFCSVSVEKLAQVAQQLRNLGGKRRCWGIWRAVGHDLFYEFITSQGNAVSTKS